MFFVVTAGVIDSGMSCGGAYCCDIFGAPFYNICPLYLYGKRAQGAALAAVIAIKKSLTR